ncbi:MAG TPA: glycosyltransferase 87 family protein [Solirubrobacteraceae bacterium]|nr:glycosyltransferase 87 family protein [Solirubrobacteraceae bacterium]
MALTQWAWTDYDAEARPAFDALVRGHFSEFLHLAPAYGGSLLLRAPFVLLTKIWGGGELSIFRAAAAPCLAASAILAVWLAAQIRAGNRARFAAALAVLLCVANPITVAALRYGHPEELLGGVLCVAAVLAATRNRPMWAGVLLGLAIANKEWALLAVGPVLIGLPDGRPRALLIATVVAVAALAPFVLVSPGGLVAQTKGAATQTGHLFNPWQVWWFLGSHAHPVIDASDHVRVGYRTPPGWIETSAHPLIVALMVPFTLACLWLSHRRRRRPAHEALLLLTLLLLVRFILDPWDISYYALPFLLALLTWETIAHDGPPLLSCVATFAAWFALEETSSATLRLAPDVQALIFLAFAVPAAAAIGAALYAPGLIERLALRVRRAGPLPIPA